MRVLRAVLILMVFVVLGPLAGLAQLFALSASLTAGPPFGVVGSHLWWEVVTLGLAVGLVPSVVAGAVSATMATVRQPRLRTWLLTLLAGAGSAAAFGFAITGSLTLPPIAAAAGLVGAALCQSAVDLLGAAFRRHARNGDAAAQSGARRR